MIEWNMIHNAEDYSSKNIWYVLFDEETIVDASGNPLQDSKGNPFSIKNYNFEGVDKEYYEILIRPCLESWRHYHESDTDSLSESVRETDCYRDDFKNMANVLSRNEQVQFKTSTKSVEDFVNNLYRLIDQCMANDDDDDVKVDNIAPPSPKTNWQRWNLVEREKCANGLLEKLKQYDYVNLTGVGGYGKTSLTNLLVFDDIKQIKSDFLNVAYFDIENNIKKAVVQRFVNSPDFCNNEQKTELNNSNSLDAQYHDVIMSLGKESSLRDKINLFILDINDYDDTLIENFVKDMIDNANLNDEKRLYPKGWKVLIISRTPVYNDPDKIFNFNIDYNIDKTDKVENDIKYLGDIFSIKVKDKPLYNEFYTNDVPNSKLRDLFEILFYSPQLVKILSYKIERNTNEAKVYEFLKTTKQKAQTNFDAFKEVEIRDQHSKNKYVGDYLNNLVKFRSLPKNEQRLMNYFMVWPAGSYINDSIVADLTAKCKVIGDSRENLENAFDTAENNGRLIRKNNNSSEFSLHGMLAETMRKQYFDRFSFPLFRFVWYKFGVYKRYQQYISNCEAILQKDSVENMELYINCIAESLKYDIGDTLQLAHNERIEIYRNIITKKAEIKAHEQDTVKLAKDYYDLGKIYQDNRKDYSVSDANSYFRKSVDLLLDYKGSLTKEQEILLCEECCLIAEIYLDAGDVANAQKYYEKIVSGYDNVYSAEANYRLGRMFYSNKDVAIPYYKNAFSMFDSHTADLTPELQYHYAVCCGLLARIGDVNYDKPTEERFQLLEKAIENGKDTKISDIVEIEIFADVYCRMGDWYYQPGDNSSLKFYKISCNCFEHELLDDVELYGYTKINKANAYYRYALLFELSHPFIEDNKVKANSFYVEADEIFASLPPETEGDLKGFIKTSYGIYDPIFGFKLVKVEKGSFDMGISDKEVIKCKQKQLTFKKYEMPCHHVEITEDFYVGMYPVTKGQWKKCSEVFELPKFEVMEYDGKKNIQISNPGRITNENVININIGGFSDNCPMNYVNANDADDFIKKINAQGFHYSLPTEAQWEYAARGGNLNRRFLYSGSDNIDTVADYGKKVDANTLSGEGPSEVGSRKPNELGIYDMSGNVFEWCQDWYDDYPSDNSIDPHGPDSGSGRVLRGGSWYFDASNCRVSFRSFYHPVYRGGDYGFRLFLSSQKNKK
ncbi:MAG: formylglycine-generating enzyme family protein [Bacteroidales bacterium]|nr:formylglycine-generating enzyme family protein [Bacteroidales bacterium]